MKNNMESFKKVINKLNEEDYNIVADYITDLEKEKNKDKQFNAGFNEATKICSEKIIALEDALDKACNELEYLDEMYQHICGGLNTTKIKDEWKEWALKDE